MKRFILGLFVGLAITSAYATEAPKIDLTVGPWHGQPAVVTLIIKRDIHIISTKPDDFIIKWGVDDGKPTPCDTLSIQAK